MNHIALHKLRLHEIFFELFYYINRFEILDCREIGLARAEILSLPSSSSTGTAASISLAIQFLISY
jgi:hypothetical protein